jgi:NTE family protein
MPRAASRFPSSIPGLPAALIAVWAIVLAVTVEAAERPRVGLVLSGGGARGVAHLGVLRVLEELRVPVDCIAGTSMGALVGGAYSAGVPVEEIIARVEGVDWDDLFNDEPPRTEKPFRAKQDDYLSLFRMEFGLRGWRPLLPTGVVSGYKFEFFLRELTARAGNFADRDFDDLPIPYRSVGTNLETGRMKVFERGDLVKAMRASMSVPGAIAPVDVEGVLYVDGGLLHNLPVDIARAACADVVIAVNLGSPLLPRSELTSILSTSYQSFNLLTEQNVNASLAELTRRDVLIEPQLTGFSFADFENAARVTIPLGEAAARKQSAALRRLSVSEEDYQAWKTSVAARLPKVLPVTEVKVTTTLGRVDPGSIEEELGVVPGMELRQKKETDFSLDNLHRRLTQVYGRGDFERMDYLVHDEAGKRSVEVQGIEKSWGPNYLKFGLGLAFDGDVTRADFVASHRRTWLNSVGGEWRNDLRLGFHNHLSSEFFQPASARVGAFVAPRIELDEEPIVFYNDGRRIGEYRVSYARAHLDLGWQNKYGEFRTGVFGGALRAREDFGIVTAVQDVDNTQVGYTASLIVDQIDSVGIPRHGVLARLATFGTVGDWGSEDEYNRSEMLLLGARSFGRHALQLAGYGGWSLKGDIPVYDPYRLGGFLEGSGYRFDELSGREVYLARSVYTYEIAPLPPPIGRGVFLGGSLEGFFVKGGLDPTLNDDAQLSGSVFAGADTFLGPAYLGWGKTLEGRNSSRFYFTLGIR